MPAAAPRLALGHQPTLTIVGIGMGEGLTTSDAVQALLGGEGEEGGGGAGGGG